MDLKNGNLFEVGAYSERGLVKFSTFLASSKWILKKGTITYEKCYGVLLTENLELVSQERNIDQ